MALLSLGAAAATAGHAHAKYAAIVIDAATGEVLHETNADTRNYPASLTKMMTLYMVFEALERGTLTLNQKLTVSKHATAQQPSKIGLKAGQTISVEDAILSLVTKSANDIAVVVAEALGGTESGFAKLMTKKAKALGMSRTTFYNASGLPDSRQKSTARDMARLSLALLRDYPKQYAYFSTRRFTYKGTTYGNHNKLLGVSPGVDGIKTGYIRASGYNIALSAVRDGRRIIVVVFGGTSGSQRNTHASDLMAAGFKQKPGKAKSKIEVAQVKPAPKPDPALPPVKPIAAATLSTETAAVAAAPLPVELKATDLAAQLQPPAPQPVAPTQRETQVAALNNITFDAPPAASGWQVQVGAFSRFAAAQDAAGDAGALGGPPLVGARVFVMEIESQGSRLYRARLVDLEEVQAREACHALEQQKIDCLVVAPGS